MTGQWVSIAGCVIFFGVALRGVHMLTRPASYLGTGMLDARDPRTVRFFGGFQLLGGTVVAILALLKVAQG